LEAAMISTVNIEIDPKITIHPSLAALIHLASEQLEEVLKRSAEQVHAQWRLQTNESGRVVVRLELSEGADFASRDFTESELRDRESMWFSLYWLWGNVLRERSKKLSADLHELVQQLP
jgi:hypothetical protein